jgi:CheY-like chemotaxis protein
LLATEDSGTANLLKRHLHGYQVRSVSAEELPTAIETYLPHAVITQALSSTSAVDKEPALKPAWPVPVVACSLPDPHYLSRALGVDHYLVKPVTRERLLSLLADYGDAVKRVLIIDDDAQLAELLARIVRAGPKAYTVDITCGGEEGLAQMQAYRPDLVLLDLMMTGVDGLTVLQLMRANDQLRELPVVIITARDLPSSEVCLPGQSRIVVEGMENFTVTAGLNCVQAILDALPAPRPTASPQPRPVAGRLHQPAS